MIGGKKSIEDPGRFTVIGKLYGKKKKTDKMKRLEKYSWGIGIEHEMHIFHEPLEGVNKKIDNFILIDGFTPILRLLKAVEEKKIKMSERDLRFLETIPFEATGRKCNGVAVLQKAPVNMPEFITTDPVSNLKKGKKGMEHYCREILDHQNNFYRLLRLDKTVRKQIEKYGELSSFPLGMSNYISFPKNNTSIYKFDRDKNGKIKVNTEYTGSYHITMTLPNTAKTTDRKFIEKHQNFANQLQWLEPLLLTAFFSCDDKAVGTTQKRIRGSYRILRIGWGNIAGSDVRKFKTGIGRYSDIDSYWRDGLDFYQKNKLKPCLTPTPPAIREGGISALSSNFRTFDASKQDKYERSSAPMKKPYGMEFRIFDHFQDEYLVELCKVLVYVAENSRKHMAKKYVYKNKAWIGAMQNIMMHGWRAIISEEYIKELRSILKIPIKTKSRIALTVFETVSKELFKKNKDGDYSYLMLDKKYKKPPHLPDINRRSWNHGFMVKLNRESDSMKKYNTFLEKLPNGKHGYDKIKALYKDAFKTPGWMVNYEDVLYYMEHYGKATANITVTLTHKNSKISFITINKKRYSKIVNFNEQIYYEWNKYKFDSIYNKWNKNIM